MIRARRRIGLCLHLVLPAALLLYCLASPNAVGDNLRSGVGDPAAGGDPAGARFDPTLLPYVAALSDVASRTAKGRATFGQFDEPAEAALAAAYAKLAEAQAELGTLTQAQDGQKQPLVAGTTNELKDRLKLALQEAADLQKKADALVTPPPAPPPKTNPGVPILVPEKGKKPIQILLVGNQVVPIADAYFAITKRGYVRDGSGNNIQAVEISRVKDGEPLQAALRDGGVLARLIRDSDPKTQFFAFLVCADAIDAFREARRVVSRKGFSFFWDTAVDKPFVVHAGGNTSDSTFLTTPPSR
jgi:hypothetical protein